MKLPKIQIGDRNVRRQMVAFGGLNYAEGAGEGELRESMGLSSAEFPAISQRKGREVVRSCTTPNSIFAWGKLCVVDGTSLLYDGKAVGTVLDGPKEWAVVNTKLCIFPDKKYLDLESMEFGGLEDALSSKEGTKAIFTENSVTVETEGIVAHTSSQYMYSFDEWYDDGKSYRFWHNCYTTTYDSAVWSDGEWTLTGEVENEVERTKIGGILMLCKSDISGAYLLNVKLTYTQKLDKELIKTVEQDYSENDDRGFYAVVTNVETIDKPNSVYVTRRDTVLTCDIHDAAKADCVFTARFAVGDRVELSGCVDLKDNNLSFPENAATDSGKAVAVVKKVEDYTLTFADGTFTAGEESGTVTVKRPVPDLKFICESDNRLWGCEGHTVWASALGDPKNFHVYDGLSTDSYAVAVGSDGDFTGCVAYSDSVLFWKEQCLHKVLGSYPAEYTLYTYGVEGVQAGSHKSMALVNEVLYYKGRTGVFAYTGGTPSLLSGALGNRQYTQAAGGSDGRRYYVAMREGTGDGVNPSVSRFAAASSPFRGAKGLRAGTEAGDGGWSLFVYDIRNRIWLREDDAHVLEFANLGGELYALSAGGEVWRFGCDSGEAIEWMAELVPFTEETLERKRLIRLLLRLELEPGAAVQVEERQDQGPWRRVWHTGSVRSRTFTVPLMPRRCDQYAVRLSGKGRCIVRSLVREFQAGGGRV